MLWIALRSQTAVKQETARDGNFHGAGLPEYIISKVGCFRWFTNPPQQWLAEFVLSLSQPKAWGYILYTCHSAGQCF